MNEDESTTPLEYYIVGPELGKFSELRVAANRGMALEQARVMHIANPSSRIVVRKCLAAEYFLLKARTEYSLEPLLPVF